MGSKVTLIFMLMVAIAMAMATTTTSSSASDVGAGVFRGIFRHDGAIDDDNEMLMPTEESRRQLARSGGYISYAALKANSVPCNRRGSSYYNCKGGGPVNPYRRGCTAITNCQRSTG